MTEEPRKISIDDVPAQVLMHLTVAWQYKRKGLPGPLPRVPITACRETSPGLIPAEQQVSIYRDPDKEPLITCPDCLTWLADDGNRLKLTDMAAWLRKQGVPVGL